MNDSSNQKNAKLIFSDITIAIAILIVCTFIFTFFNIANVLHETSHNYSNKSINFILSFGCALIISAGALAIIYFRRINQLYQELAKAQKTLAAQQNFKLQQNKLAAIGELSGGLAHEINNALVPVIGMSDILKRRLEKDSPDSVALLDTIYNSSMHARKIVQNVLAFARVQDINTEISVCEEIFTECIAIGKEIITDKNIRIKIEKIGFAEASYFLNVNTTAVAQMFGNLFKNASDAMPDGGTITIIFEKIETTPDLAIDYELSECDHLVVKVKDTGTGIDSNTIDKIFDPFFTTKDVDQGTGLGLATVYGTMRNLGGNITVDSEVGVGTTFTLYFPITNPNLFKMSHLKPVKGDVVNA